jgi:hypothetical protein
MRGFIHAILALVAVMSIARAAPLSEAELKNLLAGGRVVNV